MFLCSRSFPLMVSRTVFTLMDNLFIFIAHRWAYSFVLFVKVTSREWWGAPSPSDDSLVTGWHSHGWSHASRIRSRIWWNRHNWGSTFWIFFGLDVSLRLSLLSWLESLLFSGRQSNFSHFVWMILLLFSGLTPISSIFSPGLNIA
jgi:hypothetical protein